MRKNIYAIIIVICLLAFTVIVPVYAYTLPSFSSCLNPQGSLKSSYPTGSFGVAGNDDNLSGSDSVYNADGENSMQCFCGSNGNGIQTNWLKADTISDSDIKVLENQGWIYIPTGSLWGLDDVPYLAQNVNYTCGATSDSGGSSNTGSSNNNSSSNGASSQVAGVSASNPDSITTLAFTGNIVVIYSILLLGIASLTIGILLGKINK